MADDHRERLIVLRDQLTRAAESCSENMLPQLAGQLRATLAEIAALPEPVEASPADELVAKRRKRLADAKAAM